MKLHVAPPSPRAFKVLAVARHLELDFELCPVDLLNGANLRPEFTALNPNKKMPVLEDDGFVLWESDAIIQYLASKKPEAGLLPADSRGRADVARWQFWQNAHWDPACATLVFEHLVKKILGQGDLRGRQDEALKYALSLGLLDAFTIGAESKAEQEDLVRRIAAAA